jgi:hypothetical protein
LFFERLNLGNVNGKAINRLSYLTLVILSVAMVSMFGLTFQLSALTSNSLADIGRILGILYGSFFGCTVVNGLFAFFMVKQLKTSINTPSSIVTPSQMKV